MVTRCASAAIIEREDGKILVGKRILCGLLGVPGGKMNDNETPFEALEREVWEETSLTLTCKEHDVECMVVTEVMGWKIYMYFIPECFVKGKPRNSERTKCWGWIWMHPCQVRIYKSLESLRHIFMSPQDDLPEYITTIEKSIQFVRKDMEKNDGSHDWFHVDRVMRLSYIIARTMDVDDEVVELSAIFHDYKDPKYTIEGKKDVKEFLLECGMELERVEKVMTVIRGISFRNELEKMGDVEKNIPELEVVQDADRLDAMGAIGIARCFTYGGVCKRPLYNNEPLELKLPTLQEYLSKNPNTGTTIHHFYEKLLHLKSMMKTNMGKKMAVIRHERMETFLNDFMKEWEFETNM